jgi:hypothetical protein
VNAPRWDRSREPPVFTRLGRTSDKAKIVRAAGHPPKRLPSRRRAITHHMNTLAASSTRTITNRKLYSIEAGLAGIGSFDAYAVGSGIPATINASRRSTQVPHVPQCKEPPL